MKRILITIALVSCLAGVAVSQTTEFTYQGNLKLGTPPNTTPAQGDYDFEFRLYDLDVGGAQVGSTLTRNLVRVDAGSFSVKLDFGEQFPGAGRWLAISVRQTGGGGFTPLTPRQQISTTPYAVRSSNAMNADTATNATNATNAATATNSLQLAGVPASQYVLTTDPRMTDFRNPLPNSGNYIQNQNASNQTGNFRIAGNGFIGTNLGIRTTTPLAPLHVVQSATEDGIVVQNTSGANGSRAFFASANVTPGFGTGGTFVGGRTGVEGQASAGSSTGHHIGVTGSATGSAGSRAGVAGVSFPNGATDSFGLFGSAFGANTTNYGVYGSASGGTTNWAGYFVGNSYVGGNLGIDTSAPTERLHVVGNGFITGNLTVNGSLNATLPSNSGSYIQNTTSQQTSSNFNISGSGAIGGNLGIGTSVPGYRLDVIGRSRFRQSSGSTGATNSAGFWLFQNTPAFSERAFVGMQNDNNVGFYGYLGGWGLVMDTQTGKVGIGLGNPQHKLEVSGTGIVRSGINSDSNAGLALTLFQSPKWSVATVDPGNFQIYNDALAANAFWINTSNNFVGIGTTNPIAPLEVAGGLTGLRVITSQLTGTVAEFGANGKFAINGGSTVGGRFAVNPDGMVLINSGSPAPDPLVKLNVNGVIQTYLGGPSASNGPLCYNTAISVIAVCASSIRFKENVRAFSPGLDLVRRLRPTRFRWKQDGIDDMGLIAEEVNEVEPLLVTHNDKGEIQGVKYDRLGVVAISAIKEQQDQIEALQKSNKEKEQQIEKHQREIDALKRLVCSIKADAEICKAKEN